MDVILLEKVQNLGNLGEKVAVKSGYARNFLLPKGKAVVANKENLAAFETQRAELEKGQTQVLDQAKQRAQMLSTLSIAIAARAGDEGKLFGSVGAPEIVQSIEANGVSVEKREVRLPQGPIRQIGEYTVELHLHSDVQVSVSVSVVPE
jgi:large subunit ribosomal protein L9